MFIKYKTVKSVEVLKMIDGTVVPRNSSGFTSSATFVRESAKSMGLYEQLGYGAYRLDYEIRLLPIWSILIRYTPIP